MTLDKAKDSGTAPAKPEGTMTGFVGGYHGNPDLPFGPDKDAAEWVPQLVERLRCSTTVPDDFALENIRKRAAAKDPTDYRI